MRNGFRSSRGAMRGIIGGTAGLATVAISFRSFPVRDVTRTRSSVFLLRHELGPTTTAKSFGGLIPWPRSFLYSRLCSCRHWQANIRRDKRWNRSATSRRPHAAEWRALRPRALRRPGREQVAEPSRQLRSRQPRPHLVLVAQPCRRAASRPPDVAAMRRSKTKLEAKTEIV